MRASGWADIVLFLGRFACLLDDTPVAKVFGVAKSSLVSA